MYFFSLCEGKARDPSISDSAAYVSQTRDEKRFTISEVAADWHELMIPQRSMRPSIARAWTRSATRRHTTAPIPQ